MDTCRACLAAVRDDSLVLQMMQGNRSIAEMIQFVAGIEVPISHDLPQVICRNCLNEITIACNIKETCINSDSALKLQIMKYEDVESKLIIEPYIYEEDLVKDEPVEEFCVVDTPMEYDYTTFDPMRTLAERYSPDESSSSRNRSKPSTSRQRRLSPPPPTFKCYLCNEVFFARKMKNEHLKLAHSNDVFKCPICRHKSQTARGLDNHLMVHENPDLLSHMCHICSKHYQKACELRRHIKLSHAEKGSRVAKFFCDCCDFKTFSKMNVKRHLRTIHLKIRAFQCQFCPEKKYTSKLTLDQHMITKHGQETDFFCRSCGRKFPTMSFLRSHSKSTCTGNPASVRDRGDPNEYREQLGDSDSYRCRICSVIVQGKAKISQHYAQRHKHSNACELCPATFNSYSNLKKHIQILHKKIHKFECSFCGKRFGQKNQLMSHENTHTGAKPFTCKFDFCQFRSGDLSAVSKHQKKCPQNPLNLA